MQTITSAENKLVKKVRKLKEKKYRYLYGEYVAEGLRWVQDIVHSCTMSDILSEILVKESAFSALSEDIVTTAQDCMFVVQDDIFDKLTDTEHSQGILAVVKMRIEEGQTLQAPFCLLLDRIRDPGNLGTIIRSACAAGIGDIMCLDCVDCYNPKVIRSCMTGILHVNLLQPLSVSEIKQRGYTVLAADMQGKNVFTWQKPSGKLCLVIGNEANGICEELLSACDESISLPMENIESLNAAVSAGILMYEMKFGR